MSIKSAVITRQAVRYAHAVTHANTLEAGTSRHAVATMLAAQELNALIQLCVKDIDSTMPPDVRDIIMHSLGAKDDKPRSGGHRNYYAPKKNDGRIVFAVDKGWMEWGAPYRDTRFAHVTESGARAAGDAAFFAYRRHLRSQETK